MISVRKQLSLIVGVALAMALAACGGGGAGSNADSAALASLDGKSGPEREQALYDGAKKEGSVTWYTGLIPEQIIEPMKKAFESKYPGVRLDYYRAGSSEIATKILTEARARSPQSDVWDGAHAAEALKAAGAAAAYVSPSVAHYPAELRDKDGFWAAGNLYIKGIAFNTDVIDPATAPKTFEDLLDPRYRGKMAWTPEATGGADFIGNVLQHMGEPAGMDYLQRLAQQDLAVVKVSSRQLVNMAIAGQYPLVIQVFNNHVEISREQNAPIEWRALDVATQELNPMGVTAGSPHPFAGRLLLDFILSPEGQNVFKEAGYVPASPDVAPADPVLSPTSGGYATQLLSPSLIEEKSSQWTDIFNQLNQS